MLLSLINTHIWRSPDRSSYCDYLCGMACMSLVDLLIVTVLINLSEYRLLHLSISITMSIIQSNLHSVLVHLYSSENIFKHSSDVQQSTISPNRAGCRELSSTQESHEDVHSQHFNKF